MFSVLTVHAGYTLNIDTVPALNSTDILLKILKMIKLTIAIIETVTLNQKIKQENLILHYKKETTIKHHMQTHSITNHIVKLGNPTRPQLTRFRVESSR